MGLCEAPVGFLSNIGEIIMKRYNIDQFRGFFSDGCLNVMEAEFLIAMKYAERHLNKATLTEEEREYFADIVDRLETLSAHNLGFTLKVYRSILISSRTCVYVPRRRDLSLTRRLIW
jgi:hypothetical protein